MRGSPFALSRLHYHLISSESRVAQSRDFFSRYLLGQAENLPAQLSDRYRATEGSIPSLPLPIERTLSVFFPYTDWDYSARFLPQDFGTQDLTPSSHPESV